MRIPGTLLFGILVASFASSVLASAIPDLGNDGGGGGGGGNNGGGGGGNNGGGGGGGGNNGGGEGGGNGGGGGGGGYDTCADGSRRNPATAASQAGPLPYCASYVSTSISTVTKTATTTVKGVVTKSDSKETDGKTTLVKTVTVTGTPHTVTSTVPVIVTVATTLTTTTTAPVVVVTSVVPVKRDRGPPKPANTSTKCSCIVLFSTTTITSTKTQSAFTTTTITILKSSLQTITTTSTSTINPTTTLTIPVTTTTTTTQTTTQTIASTSTVIRSIPSACAGDLTAPPVNLAVNTYPHPEQTYTSIYAANGIILPDVAACCTACYTLSGCYAFGFGNFNPAQISPQLGGNYCQVFVGISQGIATPNTCAPPERVNFVAYQNPGRFGAGPGDFFYAATGPCAAGIDVSTIV